MDTLAIASCFRDDAPYLREWIEFHRLVGVERFILFNNLSSDSSSEVLQPYVDRDIVIIIPWPFETSSMREWTTIQTLAFNKALSLVRGSVKWLAFLDTDEFLFSTECDLLPEALIPFEEFGGVGVNWQVFGTSHIEKIETDELLIEKLILKQPVDAPTNLHIKSIVRPERVACAFNPHTMIYLPPYCQVDCCKVPFVGPFSPSVKTEPLRIHHYMLRDEGYMRQFKLGMRLKWGFDREQLLAHYESLNQLEDRSITRFAAPLRKSLGLSGPY